MLSILHKMQKHKASVNVEMEKCDTSHEMCLLRCKCVHTLLQYLAHYHLETSVYEQIYGLGKMLFLATCEIVHLHCNETLHCIILRLKKVHTTQQHFFLTVNIVLYINIKLMLQKILTSLCCKITTLFRDIEVQNLHFNVTGLPWREITYTILQCVNIS